MEFEWDPAKAAANLHKHNVLFESAVAVFLDPNRVDLYDRREAYGEDRWITIGEAVPALLSVVYTLRGTGNERIRLISARKADSHERKRYRQIHN